MQKAYEERNKQVAAKFGVESKTGKFRTAEEAFSAKVRGLFGLEQGWVKGDYDTLRPLAREKGGAFFTKTVALAEQRY